MKSDEALFEQHKAWAELKATKRHTKLRLTLSPHLVPEQDELINCALAGLWKAILEFRSKGKSLKEFADSKIGGEFTLLRRQYARYETNRPDFEHGSSNDVDRIVDKQRSK